MRSHSLRTCLAFLFAFLLAFADVYLNASRITCAHTPSILFLTLSLCYVGYMPYSFRPVVPFGSRFSPFISHGLDSFRRFSFNSNYYYPLGLDFVGNIEPPRNIILTCSRRLAISGIQERRFWPQAHKYIPLGLDGRPS